MRTRTSLRDATFAVVTFLWVVTTTTSGCASHRHAGSPSATPGDDKNVAILNIRSGEDRQAEIRSFDGVTFDVFSGRYAKPGHFRVPLQPGLHELRVVVPGPCTYYDGRPGPGSSLATMSFWARAGVQYEVTLASFPSQLFTLTQVHVYEVVKAPYEFRSVESNTSNEPDPFACPEGRGMAR